MKLLATAFTFVTGMLCAADFHPNLQVAVAPRWSAEIVADLSDAQTRGTQMWPGSLMHSNRAELMFLDNDHLLVGEAVLTRELSSRKDSEISSAYRLHAMVLDANSGRLLLSKDWGTPAQDWSIHATRAGVLVRTGNLLKLYSGDFMIVQNIELRELNRYESTSISVSTSRNTVMFHRLSQKSNVSHFDVFDGATLGKRLSWDQNPPLYRAYSISDTEIAATQFDQRAIILSEFGSNKWRVIPNSEGTCVNLPTLVTSNILANGCHELSLISTGGQILMRGSSTKDTTSGKISVAQDGGFAVVSLDKTEIKKHIFSEPSILLRSTTIAVYNLSLKKRVLAVEVAPLPRVDYDFAISPDGSMLAVLTDRMVSVYSIPSS